MYGPGTLNWISNQFPFNIFDFCSNSIQLKWNWLEIEQDRKKQLSLVYPMMLFLMNFLSSYLQNAIDWENY